MWFFVLILQKKAPPAIWRTVPSSSWEGLERITHRLKLLGGLDNLLGDVERTHLAEVVVLSAALLHSLAQRAKFRLNLGWESVLQMSLTIC